MDRGEKKVRVREMEEEVEVEVVVGNREARTVEVEGWAQGN